MAEEKAVTKPTRYILLRHDLRAHTLSVEREVEARGAEAAISKHLDTDGVSCTEHESIVAVPASNWTERGAKIKNVRTVELVELGQTTLATLEPPEDDGA